jgi:hypothetical protein
MLVRSLPLDACRGPASALTLAIRRSHPTTPPLLRMFNLGYAQTIVRNKRLYASKMVLLKQLSNSWGVRGFEQLQKEVNIKLVHVQ